MTNIETILQEWKEVFLYPNLEVSLQLGMILNLFNEAYPLFPV